MRPGGVKRTPAGERPAEPGAPVFVAIAKPEASKSAFQLTHRLRREGLRVEMEQAGRSMKGQLKQADRVGAFATVILGDDIQVKDMQSGDQREIASLDEVLGAVREVPPG